MDSRNLQAAAIARDIFGVGGEVHPLPGEVDLNFRIHGHDRDIVLKLAHLSRLPVFDLITACLYHLAAAKFPGRVPRLVAPSGPAASDRVAHVTFEGAPYVACAVTWLHGIPLAELRPRSPAALEDLGALLAELDAALAGFDHPALERDFAWRMESAPATIRAHLRHLDRGRDLVAATLDRATARLDPVAGELPRAVIHNDGNDFNVLVRASLEGARLTGLIDFGDMARSWRAAEVAIAATYAMLNMSDPLEAACAVARGYASVTPLTAAECCAVVPMIALRLCQSVTVQARQMREQPGNEYLAVSQKSAWRLLELLARTDWRIAEFRIREACGMSPNPSLAAVTSWMPAAEALAPVMSSEVLARPHVLDMSVESPDLPHPEAAAQPGAAEAWIERQVGARAATVGIGRYGEARLLYDSPAFQARGDHGPESRTVHLGLDFFAPANSPVCAPLAGTVLAVAHNDKPLDYGPTVILSHATPDGTGFHTLYGHLDRATLDHLSPGDRVQPGDVIGWLGDASVNGGWPPHLHLQVMALDPLFDDGTPPSERGNYPGVVLHRLRAVWESILPDPTPLAGLPAGTPTAIVPLAEPVLRKHVLCEKRKMVLSSSLSLSYADPIHVVRGVGAYLYDDTGRRYLDTVNNVPHVGHANPRVAEAIARQSRVLNTNTRYLHNGIVALAEELMAHFPTPLEVVFLVCSGSEANELALRMARCHTGHDGVVCLEGGYHGNTGGLVEISHYKFAGPGGAGPSDRVVAAAMPDVYRGRFRRGCGLSDEELGVRYAGEVGDAAKVLGERGHGVAAFVAEPILSCGGQIEPPPGYLENAYRHVREADGVCVADEVQVGFGRVGDAFWGFELQGVVPDIVTLGKPMGNGHPVAAVVTTREIADSFANGMEYFSTFGGNPVSCAAARAVLAEIGERGLVEHARAVGAGLLGGLGELAARHSLVGDVRGRGLFLGIEIVRDRETREPFPEACTYIVNRAREMGVLLSADGPGHNVLKVKPPMVFNEDDAAWLVETLDAIMGESALARPTGRRDVK
ncbi:MAG: aminotransferase class III-fold pyridoxal phosphate-dependent enzyme [Gemmatimonadota bacterium]|nr:aminotransferase class III-fold pyridoxal phosphate-dependent enzyme [Gemmatimonadota bacterium]